MSVDALPRADTDLLLGVLFAEEMQENTTNPK